MKTLTASALLACSALLAGQATAQSRPASSSAPRTTTAKPATASKPAAAKPAATKPAPAQPPVETAPAAPAPAKTAAAPKASSTNQPFGKGSTAANLGVGFGLGYGYAIGGLLGWNVSSIPALSLSVERGIVDDLGPGVIGVGALVGYKSSTWKAGAYRGTWRNIIVAARGAYHYDLLQNPKLDTYAGISLGVRMETYSDNFGTDVYSNDYGGTSLTSGFFVGGRYMLTNNLGAFGEVGYDMSYLKIGLTGRF